MLDCEMTRLSAVDPDHPTYEYRGAEYFCMVPRANGKRWRERRQKVLTEIDQAMSRGEPPGEIHIELDA